MSDLNIQSLMTLLPQVFLPEQARGVSAVINFNLSGDGGGAWTVTIRDQKCTTGDGSSATPDLSLAAKAKRRFGYFHRSAGSNPRVAFRKTAYDR